MANEKIKPFEHTFRGISHWHCAFIETSSRFIVEFGELMNRGVHEGQTLVKVINRLGEKPIKKITKRESRILEMCDELFKYLTVGVGKYVNILEEISKYDTGTNNDEVAGDVLCQEPSRVSSEE